MYVCPARGFYNDSIARLKSVFFKSVRHKQLHKGDNRCDCVHGSFTMFRDRTDWSVDVAGRGYSFS